MRALFFIPFLVAQHGQCLKLNQGSTKNVDEATEVINEDTTLKQHEFLMVFADWCPMCNKFKPTWAELTNEFQDFHGLLMKEADAEDPQNAEMLKFLKVTAYPSAYWIKWKDEVTQGSLLKGKAYGSQIAEYELYEGSLTKDNLVNFVKAQDALEKKPNARNNAKQKNNNAAPSPANSPKQKQDVDESDDFVSAAVDHVEKATNAASKALADAAQRAQEIPVGDVAGHTQNALDTAQDISKVVEDTADAVQKQKRTSWPFRRRRRRRKSSSGRRRRWR